MAPLEAAKVAEVGANSAATRNVPISPKPVAEAEEAARAAPLPAAAPAGNKRHGTPKPSSRYPPIEPPIDHIISRGTANYPAVVPRRQQARPASSRTLLPLEAHPLGPGRAQLAGEIEDAATLYIGQVLAGQPHGRGAEYLKVSWRPRS
jgi:hypothetical protein